MHEYKPNPNLVANAAIDSANTSSLIDNMRQSGKSDAEIAVKILEDTDMREFAKMMVIVFLLLQMGWAHGLKPALSGEGNEALNGYRCLVQHLDTHPDYIEFSELFGRSVTVQHVWDYYLKRTGRSEETLRSMTGFDESYFQKIMNYRLDKGPSVANAFGLNKEHAEELAEIRGLLGQSDTN